MIVCVCEGITDREVRERAQRGCASLDQLKQHCRAGGDCGSCRADLRRLLRESRALARTDER